MAPPKRLISVRVLEEIAEAIDARAEHDGVSRTAVVEAALVAYLAVTPQQRARHLAAEMGRLARDIEGDSISAGE